MTSPRIRFLRTVKLYICGRAYNVKLSEKILTEKQNKGINDNINALFGNKGKDKVEGKLYMVETHGGSVFVASTIKAALEDARLSLL